MRKIFVDASKRQTCTVLAGIARILPINKKVTTNQAEYLGIVEGLRRAADSNLPEIEVLSDSQLAIKQLNHQYKIKNPELIELARQAREVMRKCFDYGKVKFTWIPREENPAGEVLG